MVDKLFFVDYWDVENFVLEFMKSDNFGLKFVGFKFVKFIFGICVEDVVREVLYFLNFNNFVIFDKVFDLVFEIFMFLIFFCMEDVIRYLYFFLKVFMEFVFDVIIMLKVREVFSVFVKSV